MLSFSEWRCWLFVVVIFKQPRKQILYGLSLLVAHRVNACVHHFGKQLVSESAALAVASDDAPNLPEREVIEECVVVDSYLANE